MSECGFILAQGESCPKCQKRKPLDGYDWRSRWLTVVASVAVGTPQSDALYSLAAYIESLEADMDALVGAASEIAWRRLPLMDPDWSSDWGRFLAAIARVKESSNASHK
jgi:hypothetical protein